MVYSAQGFLAGKAASMGLGFGFWLLAARLCPATTVGLTGAAIASTMLAVQISLLGIDQSILARYSAYAGAPSPFVRRACAVVAVAALGCALLLLGAAQSFSQELRATATDPFFALLFMVMAVAGTISTIFDRVSMAQHRGRDTAVRNSVNGALTIVSLIVLRLAGLEVGARELFGCWVLGSFAALAIAGVQFRGGLRPRLPVPPPPGPLQLIRSSLRLHALALAERFPAIVLPIIVTEAVSAEANAHWYPVWMIAWAAYLIPWSYAMALFAEASRNLQSLRERRRHSTASSMAAGGAAALGLGVAGGPILMLLGRDYAATGWLPLVVLLTAVLPLTITGGYLAVCRGTNRLTEAILAAFVCGVLGLVAAGAGGHAGGLIGLSLGWTIVQWTTGLWATWRANYVLVASGLPSRGLRPVRAHE